VLPVPIAQVLKTTLKSTATTTTKTTTNTLFTYATSRSDKNSFKHARETKNVKKKKQFKITILKSI